MKPNERGVRWIWTGLLLCTACRAGGLPPEPELLAAGAHVGTASVDRQDLTAVLGRFSAQLRIIRSHHQGAPSWPLAAIRSWRLLLNHAEDRLRSGITATEHQALRSSLEAEWAQTSRTLGTGPEYLHRRAMRLTRALDLRLQNRRPKMGSTIPAWPLTPVVISSPYGWRRDPIRGRGLRFHEGVDLVGPAGAAVSAMLAGRVQFAGWKAGYGKFVELDHGDGLSTVYAHLHSIRVETGHVVGQGDSVGTLGSTGRSTGPHLHFEVRRSSEPQNPEEFLRGVEYLVDAEPTENRG
ncbi:MAG: M23 family metallopeptidase [Myxococcota bacterium]